MEFTELPQIICARCKTCSIQDRDLREGAEFRCPHCACSLLVVAHEIVVRVVCEEIKED